MNGASNVRLVALVNGVGFPVRRLGPDELVITGFPAGLNPFHPYDIGTRVPMTVIAERDGRREAMSVNARFDDLFGGDATFSLPDGFGAPAEAPSVVRMAFPSAADAAESPAPRRPSGDGAATAPPDLVPPVYVPPPPPAYGAPPAFGTPYGADPYGAGPYAGSGGPTFQPTGPAMPIAAVPVGADPYGNYGAPVYGQPSSYGAPGMAPSYAMPTNYGDDPSALASGVYQPYGDGALATDPHVADTTEREELMRIEPQNPVALVPSGPTYGMSQVPMVAPGTAVAVTELPEDDESTAGKFGRGALFLVLGVLALFAIGALMLLQRSGVQSVQAALRGQTTDITAPADGRIQKMAATEGSDVRAGQELFTIDGGLPGTSIDEMRVDVEERTRMLEQTQNALDEARRLVNSGGGGDTGGAVTTTTTTTDRGSSGGGGGSVTYVDPPDPSRIAAAEARVSAARIRQRETSGALTRSQRLFDGGALTRTDLEAARADAQVASAELEAREADLRGASMPSTRTRGSSVSSGRSGGSTTRTTRSGGGGDRSSSRLSAQLRLLDLERDIMRQQSELRQAETHLGQASNAPQGGKTLSVSNGVVSTVYRNAGSVVRAGDPIMAIETTAQPSVIAYFPFSEARLIRGGAEASVTFPAVRQTVAGQVDAIGAAALGTFGNRFSVRNDQDLTPVRIRLKGALPADVAPGAQADASVEVGLRTVFLGRLH